MSISYKQQLLFLINEAELLLARLRRTVEEIESPQMESAPVSIEEENGYHSATCNLCQRGHTLMTAECVADELCIKPLTVYTGSAGTRCLYQGKIKQGRNVFWLRSQVKAHKRELATKGKCTGACLNARQEQID